MFVETLRWLWDLDGFAPFLGGPWAALLQGAVMEGGGRLWEETPSFGVHKGYCLYVCSFVWTVCLVGCLDVCLLVCLVVWLFGSVS